MEQSFGWMKMIGLLQKVKLRGLRKVSWWFTLGTRPITWFACNLSEAPASFTTGNLMSLRGQAITGIKWTSTAQVGQQVVQFGMSVALARLLAPSDFGLAAMALAVIMFLTIFKDLGTASALIREKEPTQSLISSIFWINVLVGFLGMVVLFLVAPLVADFYREPRVVPILRVLSLNVFVSSLSIVQKALLEKNLVFRTLVKVEIGCLLAGSVIGIGAALLGAGVWSLVAKTTTETVLTTAFLWVFARYRLQFCFNWPELKGVACYSLNLTGFIITNYFSRNADYLLIGRYLGAESLGFYTLAYRMMLYPLQNISAVIGRVMMPVYVKLQDQNDRLRRTHLNMVGGIAFFSFPMMLGLMILAEPTILAVYGEKWRPVIPVITILAPVGMLQSVFSNIGGIYQAKGRTDWMFRWGLASGFLTVLGFVIGLRWGIVGVAVAYAIVNYALAYPGFAIAFRLIDLKMHDLGAALLKPFFCGLVMAAFLLSLKVGLLASMGAGWFLLFSIPLASVAYFICSCIVNRTIVEQASEMTGITARLLSPEVWR